MKPAPALKRPKPRLRRWAVYHLRLGARTHPTLAVGLLYAAAIVAVIAVTTAMG